MVNSLPHQLAKIDVVTREHIEWKQESCFPSEPVFVASPGAVEEDDGEAFAERCWSGTVVNVPSSSAGVILSSVVSSDPNVSSFMLVLDAKTFTEVGRASIPASVHLDLHGLFIPASV